MEKQLFYQLQYAIFAALFEKREISEREFSTLKVKLHEKVRELQKG